MIYHAEKLMGSICRAKPKCSRRKGSAKGRLTLHPAGLHDFSGDAMLVSDLANLK
jgi:hypothetical protein